MKDYIAAAMKFRHANPAMWRGEAQFYTFKAEPEGNVLVVLKKDKETGNEVAVIFSDADTTVPTCQFKKECQGQGLDAGICET